MAQPVATTDVAIGACLSCRSLFLVTYDTPNCLLCGRLPAFTLPFATAHPEPVEGPETVLEGLPPPAPVATWTISCPHCEGDIEVEVTEGEISVRAPFLPPAPPEEPQPEPAPVAPWPPEGEEDRTNAGSP